MSIGHIAIDLYVKLDIHTYVSYERKFLFNFMLRLLRCLTSSCFGSVHFFTFEFLLSLRWLSFIHDAINITEFRCKKSDNIGHIGQNRTIL